MRRRDLFGDRPGLRRPRWPPGEHDEDNRPSRGLLVALLLACAIVITLDYHGGADSPVEPVRQAVGEVLGPVESSTSAAVRPLTSIPDWFRSRGQMREDIVRLEAQNSDLRRRVESAGYDRNRLAEYDGLTSAADQLGQAVVPARVVGLGPAQSFSRTVTIDAGAAAGVRPDQTVLNADGLVGRVLRTTRTTATVLLIVDSGSVTGGRIGESMEVGFVHGSGDLGRSARLDLELIDDTVVPARDDTVVTWGSEGGSPYVSGVPIGRVTHVYTSVRETSQRVVVQPFVDFSALDLVGVVVPSGTRSDRALIEADGSLQ